MLITSSSWCYLALAALAVLGAVVADGPKELMIQMKYPIDFTWPDEATREAALADGSYKPINTIATGIKVSDVACFMLYWYRNIMKARENSLTCLSFVLFHHRRCVLIL